MDTVAVPKGPGWVRAVLCPVLSIQQRTNASVGYLALKYLNQSKSASVCRTASAHSMWTCGS